MLCGPLRAVFGKILPPSHHIDRGATYGYMESSSAHDELFVLSIFCLTEQNQERVLYRSMITNIGGEVFSKTWHFRGRVNTCGIFGTGLEYCQSNFCTVVILFGLLIRTAVCFKMI